MQKADARSGGDRLGQEDGEVHAAIRFAVLSTLTPGQVLTHTAAIKTKPTAASVDTVACGAPQRTLLAFGGPLIALASGIWAFVRTYLVWKARGTWWGWHGAGWFLLTAMALMVAMGVAPIAGPVLAL